MAYFEEESLWSRFLLYSRLRYMISYTDYEPSRLLFVPKRLDLLINRGCATFYSNLFTYLKEDSILLIGPLPTGLVSYINSDVEVLFIELLIDEWMFSPFFKSYFDLFVNYLLFSGFPKGGSPKLTNSFFIVSSIYRINFLLISYFFYLDSWKVWNIWVYLPKRHWSSLPKLWTISLMFS